jgi:hypothetical protein
MQVAYKRTAAFKMGTLGVAADLMLSYAEHEGHGRQLEGATQLLQQSIAALGPAAVGPATVNRAAAGVVAAEPARMRSSDTHPRQAAQVGSRQLDLRKKLPPCKIKRE